MTGFGLLWCSGLTSVGTDLVREGLAFLGVVPVTAAALGAALGWRVVSASVRTSARGVRIRNVRRTLEVPWLAIDDIRIARRRASWQWALQFVLHDGQTVIADVLSGRDAYPGSVGGARLEAALGQLRDRHPRPR